MGGVGVVTFGFLLVVAFHCCFGDVYLHHPPGSNDRNCEKDVNRRNANRLFDSQNNAAGGYACPYPDNNRMYYVSGSKLVIEWTAQHGCGNPRTKCDVVLQYSCGKQIRDGVPVSPNNNEGTDRIPEDPNASSSYGMHENFDYYTQCKTRQRNKGLWIADRNLNDWRGATRTRQNNEGDRYGFECPEERDYYPYWHPTPWKDIAIFTDYTEERCEFYRNESQNVKPKGHCEWLSGEKPSEKGNWPNNEVDCKAKNQSWVVDSAWKIDAPQCLKSPFSRENHLGNVAPTMNNNPSPQFFSHVWEVPTLKEEELCVLRVRYNITPGDFKGHLPGEFIDWKFNGKNSPIKQDPYVDYAGNILSLKVNTNQYGRTFQDRSYVFRIVPRPSSVPNSATVYNLGVRGKRGNIVQVYPAVEYDFVPNMLQVKEQDIIHFQWIGSDYNPRRGPNDAEGGPGDPPTNLNENARADRSNLVETMAGANQIPLNETQLKDNTLFLTPDGQPDWKVIERLSFLGQVDCLTLAELQDNNKKRERERDPRNCAKINTPSPYFDGGMVTMRKKGSLTYMCTRNNNFSNRDQKGIILIGGATPGKIDSLTVAQRAALILPLDGNDVDNPSVDKSDIDFAAGKVAKIPTQYKDNDAIGSGTGRWMATVNQAYGEWISKLVKDGESDNPYVSSYFSGVDNVSKGAAAGIVIACIIFGAFVGGFIVMSHLKKDEPENSRETTNNMLDSQLVA